MFVYLRIIRSFSQGESKHGHTINACSWDYRVSSDFTRSGHLGVYEDEAVASALMVRHKQGLSSNRMGSKPMNTRPSDSCGKSAFYIPPEVLPVWPSDFFYAMTAIESCI